MFNTATIAQAHGIKIEALNTALTQGGWDFSALDQNNEAHVDFVTRLVTDTAARIAKSITDRAARDAKIAALRIASMTAAARNNPTLQCTRCDGKGHIRGFGHIDNGKCFACNGAGVRRAK